MPLFRPKTTPPPSMPPWLKWGVIVFVVLAFAMQGLGGRGPGGSAHLHWGLPSVQAYKAQLIPGYGRLEVNEAAPGNGPEAVCGQDVDIRYGEILAAPKPGAKAPKVQMQPLSLRLSGDALPGALQQSIVGMKAGAVREVVVPGENGVPHRYSVELLKAAPALPAIDADALPFRLFERKESAAPPVRCGDTVKALLTVWDLSGRKLLDMQGKAAPLSVHLGEGNVMLGLEMGLYGMSADGARTLIIPPALQAPLRPAQNSAGNAAEILHKIALPKHQAILVDVDLVP